MAILYQTAFCTLVFELLSHSAWKKKRKKKLSQDDPILGFYNPLSSSLQGLGRIFSAHDDSLVQKLKSFFMQLSAALSCILRFDTPRDKDTISVLLQRKIDSQWEKNAKMRPSAHKWLLGYLSVLPALIRWVLIYNLYVIATYNGQNYKLSETFHLQRESIIAVNRESTVNI